MWLEEKGLDTFMKELKMSAKKQKQRYPLFPKWEMFAQIVVHLKFNSEKFLFELVSIDIFGLPVP